MQAETGSSDVQAEDVGDRLESEQFSMAAASQADRFIQAVQYIEQGHVRVGPDPITDPAFLVTRHMEDFVTWVDTSKLKRTVMRYNVRAIGTVSTSPLIVVLHQDELDDFDLL